MPTIETARLRDCPFCGERRWTNTDVNSESELFSHYCPSVEGNDSYPSFTFVGTFEEFVQVWNGLRISRNIIPMPARLDPSSERERAVPTPANPGNPPFAVEFSPIGETVSNEWHTLKIL